MKYKLAKFVADRLTGRLLAYLYVEETKRNNIHESRHLFESLLHGNSDDCSEQGCVLDDMGKYMRELKTRSDKFDRK